MKHENHEDNLGEDQQDVVGFARESHAQENAEDVKGQEGNDDFGDDTGNDFLEFLKDVLHGAAAFMGNAQSCYEREHKCTHHINHGWYLDFEEGLEFFSLIYCHMGRVGYHVWKECRTCTIGKQTCQDGVGKGDAHSGKEEFSGSVTDVGNGWCYETDDDERYHKAQKLAEDAVEGEKRSDGSFIEEIAEDYTQQDGNDDSCQKWHFDSFHIRKIAFCLQRYDISDEFPSFLIIDYTFPNE